MHEAKFVLGCAGLVVVVGLSFALGGALFGSVVLSGCFLLAASRAKG